MWNLGMGEREEGNRGESPVFMVFSTSLTALEQLCTVCQLGTLQRQSNKEYMKR
jgi:hypothetical protein